MSADFLRGMSYFLPTISLVFTSFLPAAIQLSFLITGALSYCQAQLFRWAPFRSYMNMTPLPTNRPDAFAPAPAAEPSPYQPRIITATSRPTPSASSTNYEPPRSPPNSASETKPTLLSGLKREVSSGITSVQESARKTLKSAREMTGQESKDGKRTKKQLQQANEYEKKRRQEDARRREEADRERRARREAKRYSG
jgi:YidC/Oxa1 family membrane protein insertase